MAITNLLAKQHINGIEPFWSFAKRRLAGVPEHTFYLYLQEPEFRFHYRRDNSTMQYLNYHV